MRKTIFDIDPQLKSAVEDWQSISFVKNEMARDVYELQDELTKLTIDRIADTLRQAATGKVTLNVDGNVKRVTVDSSDLENDLFYLAVELAKDLAFSGIKLASFELPPHLCASCGASA